MFFLAWLVAAALVAHVYYAFFESRRYTPLIIFAAVAFVLGAVGTMIVGLWDDATAASSVFHQRLFLTGLACQSAAVSLLIALKAYRSRFLKLAWRVGVGLMLVVIGIAIGTADFADATFRDAVSRFAGVSVLLCMLAVCQPKAVPPATPARERDAPHRAGGRPLLKAVPPASE